jgi:surfeit locus 1 family protein
VAAPRPDWSFLTRPGWILSHLFVAGMVVLMVNLGFWQLRRLDERRAVNERIEARIDEPAAPITAVLPAGPAATAAEVDAVEYRTVTVTGRYAPDEEVLVSNRTYAETPGFWVLTPLVQDDGTAVVVNRGWVPFATTDPGGSFEAFAPTAGRVTVTGTIRAGESRSTGPVGGPVDAAEGRLRQLARADVGRLAEQVGVPVYPLYVTLVAQEPALPEGGLPVPLPPPDLGEGPHLGYAGQWFIFSTLTVIVYPLLLRRVARGRDREADAGSDPPAAASGPVASRPQPDPATAR